MRAKFEKKPWGGEGDAYQLFLAFHLIVPKFIPRLDLSIPARFTFERNHILFHSSSSSSSSLILIYLPWPILPYTRVGIDNVLLLEDMQNARETIRKFNGAELKLTEGKSRGEKRIALDFALHRVNLHPVPSIFHRQSSKDFFFLSFRRGSFRCYVLRRVSKFRILTKYFKLYILSNITKE